MPSHALSRKHVVAGVGNTRFGKLPDYDDYDLGVKYIGEHAPWNFQAAYFPRDEGSYLGDSDDSARRIR